MESAPARRTRSEPGRGVRGAAWSGICENGVLGVENSRFSVPEQRKFHAPKLFMYFRMLGATQETRIEAGLRDSEPCADPSLRDGAGDAAEAGAAPATARTPKDPEGRVDRDGLRQGTGASRKRVASARERRCGAGRGPGGPGDGVPGEGDAPGLDSRRPRVKPAPDVERSRWSARSTASATTTRRGSHARRRTAMLSLSTAARTSLRGARPRGFESLAEDAVRWPAGRSSWAWRRTRRPCDASAMVLTGGGPAPVRQERRRPVVSAVLRADGSVENAARPALSNSPRRRPPVPRPPCGIVAAGSGRRCPSRRRVARPLSNASSAGSEPARFFQRKLKLS